MIKASIHLEDKTITNIYAFNKQSCKVHEAKPDRIKGRNIPFNNNSWRHSYPTLHNGYRTTRQKINKEIEDFSSTVN